MSEIIEKIEQNFFSRAGGSKAAFEKKMGGLVANAIEKLVDVVCHEKFSDLDSTSKAMLGTVLERHFIVDFGYPAQVGQQQVSDTYVEDIPLSIKNTVHNNWMIRSNACGVPALLFKTDVKNQTFSCGLVEVTSDILRKKGNGDKKLSISAEGAKSIHWISQNISITSKAVA